MAYLGAPWYARFGDKVSRNLQHHSPSAHEVRWSLEYKRPSSHDSSTTHPDVLDLRQSRNPGNATKRRTRQRRTCSLPRGPTGAGLRLLHRRSRHRNTHRSATHQADCGTQRQWPCSDAEDRHRLAAVHSANCGRYSGNREPCSAGRHFGHSFCLGTIPRKDGSCLGPGGVHAPALQRDTPHRVLPAAHKKITSCPADPNSLLRQSDGYIPVK